MKTYPKIETLFNRSEADFKVTDELRRPEFGLVKDWVVTEKVDGTNIRVHFDMDHQQVTFSGRTDKAQIPKDLEAALEFKFREAVPEFIEHCELFGLDSMTLYGEGFGPKIQKGGGLYGDSVDFIGFDVMVNDSTFLQFFQMQGTFAAFNIPTVPILFHKATVDEVVDLCREGFPSVLSNKVEKCEGVVARPAFNLFDQRGSRVMWKLKNTDFHDPASRL